MALLIVLTRDLALALGWYQAFLGFRLVERLPHQATLAFGDLLVCLRVDAAAAFRPGTLRLTCPELANLYERLLAQGVAIQEPLQDHPPEGQGFALQDPDGNRLVFVGPKAQASRPASSWTVRLGQTTAAGPRAPEVVERVAQQSHHALQDYGILDSAPEAAFDAIVKAVAEVCQAPVATITLIDANRQWFKAHLGITVEQTPLDLSLCAHTVAAGQPLLLEDLAHDPRWNRHPAVSGGLQLGAYAGVPLRAYDGTAIGTLCVAYQEPHPFSQRQKVALHAFGMEVEKRLEERRRQRIYAALGRVAAPERP